MRVEITGDSPVFSRMQGEAGQPVVSLLRDVKNGYQNSMNGSEGNSQYLFDNGSGREESHQTGHHSSNKSESNQATSTNGHLTPGTRSFLQVYSVTSRSIDSFSTDSETITAVRNLTNDCVDSVTENTQRSELRIYEVMARTGGKEEWDMDLGSLDFDMISLTSDASSKHVDGMDVAVSVTPASSMETLTDPVGNVMYITVPGATLSSVESNHSPLTYQRPAAVKRFLAACQRLRGVFKECLCVRVSPEDHQPDLLPTGRSGHASGTGICSQPEGAAILGHINLISVMDAMETMMESIGPDDAASQQTRMEQLLSSGALRPLTDTLVGHLRHLIMELDSFTCTEGPATSASTSTFPQWRNSEQICAIVERSVQPFLGQLLSDVLAHLRKAEMEDNKCASPSTTSSYTHIDEDTISLLASMMTREIVTDLSSSSDEESGQRSPGRVLSSVGAGEQDAVEDGKVDTFTLGTDRPCINTEGNDYFSLVSMVLTQLMRKIEPSTEDAADFPTYHQGLTERIVSEFCSASGLLRNEAYPKLIKIQRVCKKMYKELLKNFISKDMVHKLLLYRIPVFSIVLTKCLVSELLRLVQKDSEREDGRKVFNFFQRFKVCRKMWTALTTKNSRTNLRRAQSTEKEPCCCETGAQTCSVQSSLTASPSCQGDANNRHVCRILKSIRKAFHKA